MNDAPALAAADVGVAMGGGAGGTALAMDAAPIALMTSDLRALPFARALGRRVALVTSLNIVFAVAVKVVVLVLAVVGRCPLWVGVLADTGSALLVVLHSLSLLTYRGPGGGSMAWGRAGAAGGSKQHKLKHGQHLHQEGQQQEEDGSGTDGSPKNLGTNAGSAGAGQVALTVLSKGSDSNPHSAADSGAGGMGAASLLALAGVDASIVVQHTPAPSSPEGKAVPSGLHQPHLTMPVSPSPSPRMGVDNVAKAAALLTASPRRRGGGTGTPRGTPRTPRGAAWAAAAAPAAGQAECASGCPCLSSPRVLLLGAGVPNSSAPAPGDDDGLF